MRLGSSRYGGRSYTEPNRARQMDGGFDRLLESMTNLVGTKKSRADDAVRDRLIKAGPDGARQELAAALEQEPYQADAHLLLARINMNENRLKTALGNCRDALQYQPTKSMESAKSSLSAPQLPADRLYFSHVESRACE